MTKRNEERLGSPASSNNAPEVMSDSGFSFTTPTEFVALPSKGKLYPEGHRLCGVEEIEIKHMTTKEEDILSSKTLVEKGVAINRLVDNVIVDKTIKQDDMLVGDRSAIILASRVTGYGTEYKANVRCRGCGKSFDYNYDLEEALVEAGDELSDGVERTNAPGVYEIELPSSKLKFTVRLLTGSDEKSLVLLQEKKKKHKLKETPITDQMNIFTVSIQNNNGQETSDRGEITKVISQLTARDAKFLRNAYVKLVPKVQMKREVTHEACGEDFEVEIPIQPSFFWPE